MFSLKFPLLKIKITSTLRGTTKSRQDKISFDLKRYTHTMIEITVNDRLGKKVRVKCNEDDTIGDLKKLIAAQTGTR